MHTLHLRERRENDQMNEKQNKTKRKTNKPTEHAALRDIIIKRMRLNLFEHRKCLIALCILILIVQKRKLCCTNYWD